MIDTILVVDEYDTHRVKLASVFREITGADVSTVPNGKTAITAIQSQRWDVVVLDLDPPEMTGLQLIDTLAQHGEVGGIVLTSAHPARVVQAAATYAKWRGVAVIATLEKPLKPGRVRAVASTLLESLEAQRSTCTVHHPRRPLSDLSGSALRQALVSRRIEGYLQPQHHTENGVLRGAEMLVRWHDSDGRILGPADFLPAFERAGLMGPLTDYMLELAFAAQSRLASISDLSISINVPTGIASSVDWAKKLAYRAMAAGAKPSHLVIEIIEDGDAASIPALTGAVTQLRLNGFNCAIDDFGMGNSSLDRLLWVPFNELKICRSLLGQARHHPHAQRILSSTISMARGLGITVVAEGVESEVDQKLVAEMGGEVTQGYLHGKAMTLDEFEKYAATMLSIFVPSADPAVV